MMPGAVIKLPPGAFRFCTTSRENKYSLGQLLNDSRYPGQKLEVILILERTEDEESVWDIYVIVVV